MKQKIQQAIKKWNHLGQDMFLVAMYKVNFVSLFSTAMVGYIVLWFLFFGCYGYLSIIEFVFCMIIVISICTICLMKMNHLSKEMHKQWIKNRKRRIEKAIANISRIQKNFGFVNKNKLGEN